MVDVKCLSDYELQHELTKLGFSPGPILPSTRKVYEKKLVQLLVSPPCASPVMNGPEELDRAQDDEDSEGTLRGCTARLPETSITKPEALDVYCLAYKHSEGIRLPARAANSRFKGWSSTRETDYCPVNRSFECGSLEILPVGLKLAVFGIFIIVIFVYITVERKPFFG
uniref:LEM domain containing 1 n=1 Tax=Ursus maritimus TaxID=29073 RepID=A0A452TAE5_URSMA